MTTLPAADAGAEEYPSGVGCDRFSNLAGTLSKRMVLHGVEHYRRRIRRNECQDLSFIGNIERVEP